MKYILQIVLYVSMIGCAQKPVTEEKIETQTIDNQKPLIINAVKYDEFIKKVDDLTKYLDEVTKKIIDEQKKYNKSEYELIEFIVKNNLHKVYIDAKEYRDFYCNRFKGRLRNGKIYCFDTYD